MADSADESRGREPRMKTRPVVHPLLDEPRVVLALVEDMRHEHRVIAVKIERDVVIHWSRPVP